MFMTNEEFNKLCEEYRAQGLDDKDILNVLYKMYADGKIEKEDLSKLAGALGYELSDEFEDVEGASGTDSTGEEFTEEEIEDAQEVDSDEAEDDEDSEDAEDEDEESDDEEKDEEDESDWKKNFGL